MIGRAVVGLAAVGLASATRGKAAVVVVALPARPGVGSRPSTVALATVASVFVAEVETESVVAGAVVSVGRWVVVEAVVAVCGRAVERRALRRLCDMSHE